MDAALVLCSYFNICFRKYDKGLWIPWHHTTRTSKYLILLDRFVLVLKKIKLWTEYNLDLLMCHSCIKIKTSHWNFDMCHPRCANSIPNLIMYDTYSGNTNVFSMSSIIDIRWYKKTGTFEKPNKNWRNPRKKNYWQKLNHYNLPFKRQ